LNGLPYYKAYPRDFLEGTIGMPFEIKCAYRVLLDLIYMQGGRLTDDPRYIAGHLGCSLRKWNSIRSSLLDAGKIEASGGFLSNYRADKELETLAKLQEKQAENARQPRKNKGLQKPRLHHTEPEPYIDTNVSIILAQFEEFWARYPRRVGKAHARRAYTAAMKKIRHDDLMFALSQRLPAMEAQDQKYRPHPATWLNGERWNDEPDDPHSPNGDPGGKARRGSELVSAFAAVAARRCGRGDG
jgi:uncharacterized protein YdaU (DUF1376 family)